MLTETLPLPLIKPKMTTIITGKKRLKKITCRFRRYILKAVIVSTARGFRMLSLTQLVAGEVEEDILQVRLPLDLAAAKTFGQQIADQGRRRVHGDNLPAIHDGHPITEGLRFVLIIIIHDAGPAVIQFS